jgi:hypothetical protein
MISLYNNTKFHKIFNIESLSAISAKANSIPWSKWAFSDYKHIVEP